MNATIETSNAPRIATFSKVRYFRFNPYHARFGYNVSLGDAGFVLMSLPLAWAEKAVRLLNACADQDEQRAVMLRIRAGIDAYNASK